MFLLLRYEQFCVVLRSSLLARSMDPGLYIKKLQPCQIRSQTVVRLQHHTRSSLCLPRRGSLGESRSQQRFIPPMVQGISQHLYNPQHCRYSHRDAILVWSKGKVKSDRCALFCRSFQRPVFDHSINPCCRPTDATPTDRHRRHDSP